MMDSSLKKWLKAAAVGVAGVALLHSVFYVHPGERVLLYNKWTGKLEAIDEEGVYFKCPMVEVVNKVPKVTPAIVPMDMADEMEEIIQFGEEIKEIFAEEGNRRENFHHSIHFSHHPFYNQNNHIERNNTTEDDNERNRQKRVCHRYAQWHSNHNGKTIPINFKENKPIDTSDHADQLIDNNNDEIMKKDQMIDDQKPMYTSIPSKTWLNVILRSPYSSALISKSTSTPTWTSSLCSFAPPPSSNQNIDI